MSYIYVGLASFVIGVVASKFVVADLKGLETRLQTFIHTELQSLKGKL